MLNLLILLIILFIILNIIGLNYFIPFIFAIINFILASLELITNRSNILSRLIQVISLAFIIHVILITIIDLGDSIYGLSSSIIYFNNFKYRRNCYVYNERTQFLYWNGLSDIKNSFLNKLNNDQAYLIKLKYQFLLNFSTNEIYSCSFHNPIIITNHIDSNELIDFIKGEIIYLTRFERLEPHLTSSWKDDMKIELVYYKLEVIK